MPATALLAEFCCLYRVAYKVACFTYKVLTTGHTAHWHMLLHYYTPASFHV